MAQLESNSVGRRDVMAKLLGAFGVATLAGCELEGAALVGAPDDLAEQQAALASWGDIKWVATVLGSLASDGKRQGDLATQTPTALGGTTVVVAQGCVTPGDGGGGLFFWSSSGTHDGGTFIAPNGTTGGGWRRIYTGPISVKWFGACGDEKNNDAPAIQAAIAALPKSGGVLVFPAGTYLQGDGKTEDLRFFFDGYKNLTIQGAGAIIKAHPSLTADYRHSGFWFQSCVNVEINGITYHGRLDGRTPPKDDESIAGIASLMHGFAVYAGSEQVTFNNCRAIGCLMDGFYVGRGGIPSLGLPRQVILNNCVSLYNYRQGLSVVGVDGLLVDSGYFSYTGREKGGILPRGGIDVESNDDVDKNRGVSIRGAQMIENGGAGVYLSASAVGTIVEGCDIRRNCGYGIIVDHPKYAPSNCVIRNNRIEDNGASFVPVESRYNIRVFGPGHVIEGNTVICHEEYGIWLDNGALDDRDRVCRNNRVVNVGEGLPGSTPVVSLTTRSGGITALGMRDLVEGNLVENAVNPNWYAACVGGEYSVVHGNTIINTLVGNNDATSGTYGLRLGAAWDARNNHVSGYRPNAGCQIIVLNGDNGGRVVRSCDNYDGTMARWNRGFVTSESSGIPDFPPILHKGKAFFFSDASPGTATGSGIKPWMKGDVCLSTSPESGGNVGWVCVAAGTPGAWREFGRILVNKSGSASWDDFVVPPGSSVDQLISVPGAEAGNVVAVSVIPPMRDGCVVTGVVVARDTVVVTIRNTTLISATVSRYTTFYASVLQ